MSHFPAHIRNDAIQTCEEHCLNTARIAGEDLKECGLYNSAFLAGVLHDCGKFSKEFEHYITDVASGKSVRKGTVIHTFAGVYYLLSRHHTDLSNDAFSSLTAEVLSYAIGAHHGLFDCIDKDKNNGFEYRLKKQPEYERRAIDQFLEHCCPEEELTTLFNKAKGEIEAIYKSLVGLIKERPDKGQDEVMFYLGLLSRLIASAVMDGDRTDTTSFMGNRDFDNCIHASREMWESCSEKVLERLDSFPSETVIQRTRREISDLCAEFAGMPTGVYRLNVPTGGGKTLSSLRYALGHAAQYGKKRIIYTAPLISILDQNAKVIRDAIGNDSLVLEHHSNVIMDGNEDDLSMYDLLAETWESPIIITTLVQLLNTLFSGKTSCVRRFQSLCNSVIIIDEVQSVPSRMLTLFNLSMNFLSRICDATIILCSATQPCFEGLEHPLLVSDVPIITTERYDHYCRVLKRTRLIDKGEYQLRELPAFVDSVLEESDSVLVVCNTKKEAGELFRSLKKDHLFCYHLSAAMCMSHRKAVLKEITAALETGQKVICVSTQVIEAGVDISFGSVIRLNAGIDSIVQAAGRCNRNGEKAEPQPVYIVRCLDERLGSLVDIKAAQDATNDLLYRYREHPEEYDNDLSSDRAVEYYYNKLYHIYHKGHTDYPTKEGVSVFDLLASNKRRSVGGEAIEKYLLRQSFKEAGSEFAVFDKEGETVIVPFGEGVDIICEMGSERAQYDYFYMKELVQKAKEYSVSIYSNQIQELERQGCIESKWEGRIKVLSQDYYDKYTGVQLKPVREEGDECNILIL